MSLVVESRGGHDHAGRELYQRLETSAIEGEIVDEGTINHGADCARFGIQQRRAGFHGDGLGRGTKGHFEIEFYGVLDVKNHIGLD